MTALTVVDAFAERPFTGNPAAVSIVERFPDKGWMQAVAAEMNLSETAFVAPRSGGDFDLRWFTPASEVDLCGHATLASAHVLAAEVVRFHTRSGVLTCSTLPDGLIEMDFPADAPVPVTPPVSMRWVRGDSWARGRFDLLVELADAEAVRSFSPDLEAIAALDSRALIVTAPSDSPDASFVSRVFCPRVGVPEDPVTGSAHCTLACYWAERTGQREMTGYQASRRGGTVRVRLDGERVFLAGTAVTVSDVRLRVGPPDV